MLPVMETNAVGALDVPLERDVFLRTLLRELSGTLQEVVGIEEAAGFVSVVGQSMGREIDGAYRSALRVDRLSREQVPEVLVEPPARGTARWRAHALQRAGRREHVRAPPPVDHRPT
jgi:hypothetical protein